MDNIIFTYTTKDALEDGSLISVSKKIYSKHGILIPVYFTSNFWAKTVNPLSQSNPDAKSIENIKKVLHGFRIALSRQEENGSILKFGVLAKVDDSPELMVVCKSVITANDFDDPSPALFFMCIDED